MFGEWLVANGVIGNYRVKCHIIKNSVRDVGKIEKRKMKK